MFKKAISWLLILALLCSGTVLSVFAAEETAEHDFMWTSADGSTGYGDFNHGSDTEDTSLRSNFGVPAGGTVTLLRNVTLRKRIRLYENPIAVLDGNGFTITGASFDVSHVALSMTIKNVTFDFTAEAENGYFNKFLQINSAEQSLAFENCRFDIKGEPGAAVFVQRGNLTLKDTYYTNMQTALSKANAGDTLTLAADYKSDGSDAMRLFNFKENLTIDGNGHTLSVSSGGWLIRAEKNVTMRNLTVVQNGTGFAMQINEGATVTLENAFLKGTNATSTAAVLRGALILNAGSKILAANGFLADMGKPSLIVNRGAEINVSGKLFSSEAGSPSKTINGGTFTIGGKLLYRDPTADEFKNNDVTLRLPNGGVATKNNSGIRFTTVVDKAWYEAMLAAGVTVEKTGTLVAPKAFVDAAGAFTPEALEAAGKLYLDIVNDGWYNGTSGDSFYYYYGNMVKLSAASINGELSGIGYMVVTVEGLGTFTVYGTQKNGIVSEIAAKKTAEDDAQQAILDFFRGSAN